MSLDQRTVAVATCDACAHKNFANEEGEITDGFQVDVFDFKTATRHEVIACKETHIGKATRAVLAASREEQQGMPDDPSYLAQGDLVTSTGDGGQ
jgi:hypothetical protein